MKKGNISIEDGVMKNKRDLNILFYGLLMTALFLVEVIVPYRQGLVSIFLYALTPMKFLLCLYMVWHLGHRNKIGNDLGEHENLPEEFADHFEKHENLPEEHADHFEKHENRSEGHADLFEKHENLSEEHADHFKEYENRSEGHADHFKEYENRSEGHMEHSEEHPNFPKEYDTGVAKCRNILSILSVVLLVDFLVNIVFTIPFPATYIEPSYIFFISISIVEFVLNALVFYYYAGSFVSGIGTSKRWFWINAAITVIFCLLFLLTYSENEISDSFAVVLFFLFIIREPMKLRIALLKA
ncbi:hypothetical protein [Butyrivibrio sp. JL13D10]|uniref:hypothetical protein n=1 Tax=Butyrivibrio sp. JL13D10 TaxID=3236815 RepID=UPI0038B5BFAA